jgi:protein-disulfide isomerase
MRTTRRLTTSILATGLVAVLGLAGLASCNQGGGAAGTGTALSKYELPLDMPVGSPDAKVVLVEYASVTCPHCAAFSNTVKPELKTRYIDTGKVRFVFRDFPTPPIPIAAAGARLARCAGPDKRDAVLDTLFRQQEEIFRQAQGPTGVRQALVDIASAAGMSEAQFDACMQNKEGEEALRAVVEHGRSVDKVTATPTLFINGERFEAPAGREIGTADLFPALDAAIAAAGG